MTVLRNNPQRLLRHILRDFDHADIGFVCPRGFKRVDELGRHIDGRIADETAASASGWPGSYFILGGSFECSTLPIFTPAPPPGVEMLYPFET